MRSLIIEGRELEARTLAQSELGRNYRPENTSRRPLHRLWHSLTVSCIQKHLVRIEREERQVHDRNQRSLRKLPTSIRKGIARGKIANPLGK